MDVRTMDGSARYMRQLIIAGFQHAGRLTAHDRNLVGRIVEGAISSIERDPATDAVVQFAFDADKFSLSVGITQGSRVHPMRVVFERISSVDFLVPFASVQQALAQSDSSVTLTIESEDE